MIDNEEKQGNGSENTTGVGIQIISPPDDFYDWVKTTVRSGETYRVSHTGLDGQLLLDEETSIQPRQRDNYAVGARIRLQPGTLARYQGLKNLPGILATLGIKDIQNDGGNCSWRGMGSAGIDFQLRSYGVDDLLPKPATQQFEIIELTLGTIYNPTMLLGALNAFGPTYEKVLNGIYQAAGVTPPNRTITLLPAQPVNV